MPDPPKPLRVSLRLDNLSAVLQQKLENEAAILDLLLSALARGQAQEGLWVELHDAALRDERVAELAFAYERLSRDKKVKSLNPNAQGAFLLHAGTFFHDIFSDPDGAEPYFERAFALLPADLVAFQKLEALYSGKGEDAKLGELYAASAPHRADRADQLELFRRAAELLMGGDADKLIKLYQEILRLDPGDAGARRLLEERYERAGRFGDLAKLLEQTLTSDPPPPEAVSRAVHLRLITLYAGIRELERALPHVEEALRFDPGNDAARAIASELLSHKALAARAAATLAGAHERLGQLDDAARMLMVEIEQLRGPRRVDAQKRLASLYYERVGDLQRTFALDEAIVPLDPEAHDVRARLIKIGTALDKHAEIVRVLSRASSSTKDPGVRARIGADLGDVLLATGDARKARVAFQGVIDARADDAASLRAGHALVAICVEAKDSKALAPILARLGEIEPDDRERTEVTLRLARLHEEELRDAPAAISAYKRLLGTSLEGEALSALTRLFEETSDHAELVPVLEARARAEASPEAARELAFRAADIRSTKLNDRAAALAAWRAYVAAHGSSREVLARLIPLLEQEKRWDELAVALGEDAALAPEAERAPILARLGQTRLGRLGDPRGALEAHRRALNIDPAERQSRLAVDKMLAAGDLRLAAADVLEPIVRAEGAMPALVRVLETRAALAEDPAARLSAIAEAAEIASRDMRDAKRGVELAGRGLEIALDAAPGEAVDWIERVERLSAAPADSGRGALALQKALGERDPADPTIGLLARRTGEALVRSGDVAGALAVFRRALAAEPSSSELLARVDALLREQGSPEERISLYRAALSSAEEPARRRELLHAIGAIERRDLGDRAAAIATYQQALREDATDKAAFVAVTELREAGEEWEALYDELRAALDRETGDERVALTRRLAEVSAARGWLDKAAAHYRDLLALDGTLGDDALTEIEKVARAGDDLTLLRAVFERRVAVAEGPADESLWLERLGDLEGARLGRHDEAAAAFKRAAEAAAQVGDRDQVQRLYERVLGIAIDDRVAAERLYDLYREGGMWGHVPGVVAVLLRTAPSAEESARVLLSFEGPAVKAAAFERFVEEADALLGARAEEIPAPTRAALRAARATVIAADPSRQHQVAGAYRAILESGEGDIAAATLAFEAFLAPRKADVAADRRWLFAFRVDHAAPGDRISILLAWAEAEERQLGDPIAASALYERIVAIDPDHDDALAARARILLARDDFEGAVAVLSTRRGRLEGGARDALDLEVATLLLTRLDRPGDAIFTVAPQLEGAAPDAEAIALARRALGRLAEKGDAGALVAAARRLEDAAAANATPEVRAGLYDALLSTPSSTAELRDARRGWFERLLEAPGIPPGEVLDIALRAVSELPDDLSVWERAERLAREADGGARVAEAYQRALAAATVGPGGLEPEAIEELGRRAVDFHEEWFDDAEIVVKLLRRTVELVPNSAWAFERLKLTYNLGERWGELFDLYDEAIARADDAMIRRDLLEDAALAAKDLAGDANRAMHYLEQLVVVRDEPRVRTALERLYERHGRHRPLIALLSRQIRELEGAAAQALRSRIAGLWLDGAVEPSSAVGVIEQMIEAEPDRAEAFDLLERVIAATTAEPRSPGDAMARQRAAAQLQDRYRKLGKTGDLVRVLEIELEGQTDPKERAERLRALVDLRISALGDEAGAFESVAALVLLEPGAGEHRAELARLAEKLGREGRLAEVLAAAAEIAEPPLKIELLFQAATVYRERQKDTERAIALYRATLAAAPERDPLALAAARELDKLLAEAGQPAERCDVLEVLAAIEPEASARRAARAELARIAWDSAKDPDRAIRAFRASITEDGRDADALRGLIHALEELGRWRELIEVLEHRASGAEAADARRDRVRVARIHDERLDDQDQAIAVYRGVRGAEGGDDEVADALAALLEKTERHADLIALLEQEATVATNADRAADLWCRGGDLHRERTRRFGEAITSYERALERRPGDPGARSGLESLVALVETELLASADAAPHRAALVAAVALLVRLYAAADDWDSAIRLLEPRLVAAADDASRVTILTETAGLLEARRGDPASAFDAIWRALSLLPDLALATSAIRLAGVADRFSVIAGALDAGFAARADVPAEVARDLFWSVARWQRDRRSDFEAAEVAIERALERDPASVEMLEALADVQRRAPSRKLIDTLLRLADRSAAGSLEHYREAVKVAEEPVADRALARGIAEKLLDAAVSSWSGATDAQGSKGRSDVKARVGVVAPPGAGVPAPPKTSGPPREAQAAAWAIEALVRLDEEGPAAVVALFLRGAKLPFDVAERRRLRARAAELADLAQSIAIYEELFAEDPHDPLPAERLDAIYREHDRKADLIRLRERQIAVAKQAAPRVELRFELAGLLAETGEMARAISVLRQNLSVTPSHPPSIARLAELLEIGGHYQDLVALCEDQASEVETEGNRGNAASLWTKAAALSETRLGDEIRAITDHRRATSLGSSESADALARLLTRRGEHAAAADVLDKLCEKTAPDALHTLVLRLTEAHLAAGSPAAARARLERYVPIAREGDLLRERLAQLYRDAGEWGPLADLIGESAARAGDPKARAARLREAADLYLQRLDDPARAVPLLEQAAALAPDDTPLRRQLAASLSAARRNPEAIDVLTTLLASYGTRRPKDRALAHYELARVLAETDRARASTELDLALRIDPAHPEVLAMLARISLEDGQLERAARTFRALLLVVRKPREEAAPAGISRTEVLIELAEIARRQGDTARAAEYLDSAFEAARESAEEGDRLLATLRARKSHETLARALSAKVSGDLTAEAAPLLEELADLYDAHLGRAPEALDARLRAFTLAKPSARALRAGLDLAARTGEIPRFVEAVSKIVAEEADPTAAVDLHLALGRAHDREGGDLRRAAEAYRAAEAGIEAAGPDARIQGVWRALDRIYGALGDVAATSALLEKQIDSADDPGSVADAIYRLAAIRLLDPATEAAGIDLLDRAMAADAQPDRAEAALRAAIATGSRGEAVARSLERLARDTGRDRTLIDALLLLWDGEIRTPSGPMSSPAAPSLDPARFDGLKEAMEIARRLGDQALVEEILRRALERPPPEGDGAIAWALTALADRRVDEGNLVEAATLKERAARASGPEEERALLLAVAALSEGPLDDLPRAARVYEELRAREPAEREIWQPLAEVYRRLGDRARLGALLDETAPLLDSAEERASLRLTRARMAMVDDEGKAIELLKEIVAENPNEVEASKLLLDLLEKHGKKDDLAALLAAQIDAAKDREDAAAIVPLSMRLGAILEGSWDEQGALDVYHAALDWAPKSRELLRAIVRIGLGRDDSSDLPDMLAQLLDVEEGEAAAEIALRLSKLRVEARDQEGAERALEKGHAACPTSAALREELAARYAAGEAWKKLADLHVRDAVAHASKEEQIEGLCHAAEILRAHGDPGAAGEILLRALMLDLSERDVLLALIDAHSAAGEHARAVEAIGRVLAESPDDPWLYRSRASLHEALGEDAQALADLETAYAKSGGGYASELIVQIDKSVKAAARDASPEGRAKERSQRLRLAEVLGRAGEIDRARAELTELARTDAKDRAALRALAALEDAAGNWDAAIATYRRLLPLEEGETLSELALRLADACEKGERLGDARSALERALAHRPAGEMRTTIRERLRAVYVATGAGRELAGLLLEDATAAASKEERLSLLIRAGRLLVDAGGEGARAVQVIEEARSLAKAGSPEDHEATPLLAEAYAAAGRVDEARALLDAVVAAQKGRRSRQLSAIFRQRARIELGEGDGAAGLAAFVKALENDPQNGALAMEVGALAVELDDLEVQNRAFRAVTMMKLAPAGGAEGTNAQSRGLAYYHLGRVAVAQGDRRKARLMVEKAVADDPSLEEARALLEQLRAG